MYAHVWRGSLTDFKYSHVTPVHDNTIVYWSSIFWVLIMEVIVNEETIEVFWICFRKTSSGKMQVFHVLPWCRISTEWAGLWDTVSPPPNPSMTPQSLVQIAPFPESKFPLDQCCSRIGAVWRLAQPRFPNGANLEGLVWPPPNHHHCTTPNLPEFMHMCKNAHRYTLFQTKWIE